jgi:hypothetical protein
MTDDELRQIEEAHYHNDGKPMTEAQLATCDIDILRAVAAAARREALEEAATLIEVRALHPEFTLREAECVDAIRALQENE